MSPKKLVYYFGDGQADGDGRMKELLGGKGANLAEMSLLRIPVPAGFTITTEVCTHYYENKKKHPAELKAQVDAAIRKIEKSMGRGFGDPKNPLLVSVRSGARASMPGMMETVLNVGLTTATIPGLIAKSNERFVWDAYRRLIMMYSDVVMEKAAGVEVEDGHGIRHQLEAILKEKKAATGATLDTDLSAQSLKEICVAFKERIKQALGKPFPDTPQDQLWGGVNAVFSSWMGKRAIDYRRIERIPDAWGTAVNVQSMVFGNLGDTSSTGVAFTRDPGTGANEFYGEYLVNAQGEDVVAGIRTPSPILKKYEAAGQISLERQDPKCFKQLNGIRLQLEKHFRDMLDIEFTIEENVLYMLQCRVGKRNGTAAVRIAVELLQEKQIDATTAVMRVQASQLTELLLPTFNEAAEKKAEKVATGLPAGPGAASGKIVFRPDEAKDAKSRGEKVILVRTETSPEDVDGMHSAEGILTAVGGMSSHAALVARGFGKTCIVGCSAININYAKETMTVGNKVFKKGDILSLNGTKGVVYAGEIALDAAEPHKNPYYATIMKAADKLRTIKVRANADAGKDAAIARKFGAEGIGLCRTEHMFFGEERIRAVREMILSNDKATRVKAISKLLPFQRNDFKELFTAMNGLPVTIRLLDPPLHEFVPHHDQKDKISELAHEFGVFADEIHDRIKKLHEANPMLGHRGCRLGITYPEITEMQARAIFEAAAECQKAGIKVIPEIMVPLVGHVNELVNQEKVIRQVATDVMAERKIKINYLLGTMIELPRACLTADQIARSAEFFSFGTNDLTQTTFGFSRDDIGTFLPDYLEKKILPEDPFQSLDQAGVGQLVEMGITLGRSVRPTLKVGICGEHGGDPASVVFCHKVGMDYVSCSPYRVPIALFAAAQAAVIHPHQEAIKMAAAKKAAKKPAAKKAAPKKAAAAKKPAAKKAAAKKPAAKKPAAKKKSGPSSSKGKKS